MTFSSLKSAATAGLFVLVAAPLLSAPAIKPDYHLEADIKNMVIGYFSAETPPVLKVKSGQIVEIDSLALMGLSDDKPEQFFTDNHVSLDLPSVQKMIAAKKAIKTTGASTAPLTGPIYIENAEPGDTLEVRIVDIKSYTPFGINIGTPGKGGIPDLVPRPYSKFLPFDLNRGVALFSKEIAVPLKPFQGMYAVAPSADRGK